LLVPCKLAFIIFKNEDDNLAASVIFYKLAGFASTAGGLRSWNAAAFASFEKYASHFSNSGKPEPNQKKRLIQLLCSIRRTG
jgi:hypothetical protein